MCASLPEPALQADRPCPMVDRMIHLARARTGWRVAVAGPAGLAALIALCRKGYEQACCVREAKACGADGETDLLLITGPLSADALADAVRRTVSLLRDGGVLVAHEAELKDDGLICAMLTAAGREVGWCVHDLSDGCLVALQVLRPGSARLQLSQAA